MTNLISAISESITEDMRTKGGAVRAADRYRARDRAGDILRPMVPTGTGHWLATPRRGERVSAYAQRAVWTAAVASAWAGGLRDGTWALDPALRQSLEAVSR